MVAAICDNSGDPQGLEAQIRILEDAGTIVFDTGYKAAQFAVASVSDRDQHMDADKPVAQLLNAPLTVINVGVEDFADHLSCRMCSWSTLAGHPGPK